MKPKVYVCSRARIPERSAMWRFYRSIGANIVSTWIDEAGESQTKCIKELWTRIESEIEQCDRVVVYVEKNDCPLKGVLVEVGMAIAFNKPVYVFTRDFMALDDEGRQLIGSWVHHPKIHLFSGDQHLNMHRYLMGLED